MNPISNERGRKVPDKLLISQSAVNGIVLTLELYYAMIF